MKRPTPTQLALLGAMIAAAIGQGALYWWYVEDAAISMAFARNLADGWGLVRFPGDERVEGYSNPLWVAYMAAGYLIGVDGFGSTKVAAGLLGSLLSVPLAYLIAKRAEIGQGWAVLAAWVLAVDAQFIIWSACGLENSLFCALLALACWRTLREAEVGGFPWAAVGFLGLSLTRPEGIVYAALGGLFALALEGAGSRRWGRIATWLGVFWVPFLAYHAIRFDYFAFEFPATYYSKLEDARFSPFRWDARAWMYLREYAWETGRGFFLPVILAGGLGLRSWRGVVAAGFTLWLGILLLYPGVEPLYLLGLPHGLPLPPRWFELRVVSLAMVAFAVPFLALGGKGWRVRVLMWGMALLAVLFSLRSTGDWMRGFRWMSLVSVPAAVLLAMGFAEIAGAIERISDSERLRKLGIGVGALLFLGSSIPEVVYQVNYRPEVGPFAMKRRVDHYEWAMDKLFIEQAHIIDHDMGAMLYWGGRFGIIRDAKGLIDYPFALHHAQRRFVEEYLYEENRFDLAHAHASTGQAIRRVPKRFNTEYIELPGYGGRETLHVGNMVRKSLLVSDRWEGPTERSARFEGGVVLHGLQIRAPEVQPGSFLFVDAGISAPPGSSFRVLLVLTRADGSGMLALDLPLGLDDWYPVSRWQQGEVVHNRAALRIPRNVERGGYDLSVVVIGPDGVLPAIEAGVDGSIEGPPRYATGEVRFSGAVQVAAPKKVKTLASADLRRAIQLGNQLDCDGAEEAWMDARAHFIRSKDWQASVRPGVQDAIARCFAKRAEGAERAEAVVAIRRARWWDRTHPVVLEVGAKLGEGWFEEGERARERGEVEEAYAWYRDTLYADPTRAWARRYAEQLRAERLGLR